MRVGVVLGGEEGERTLANWGFRIARAEEGEVLLLWVGAGPALEIASEDEPPPETPARLAECVETLRQPSGFELQESDRDLGPEQPPALPHPPISARSLRDGWSFAEFLEVLREEGVEVLLVGKREEKDKGASLARKLFLAASPTTIVMRSGEEELERPLGRIALATAGGPSAGAALELAASLAKAEGTEVDVLHVVSEVPADSEAVGRRRIREILEDEGFDGDPRLHPRPVAAGDFNGGIAATLTDEHELLLLGASHVGSLRRLVFGTVPDRLLRAGSGPTIGVVREAWGPGDRLRAMLGRWLDLRVPQLTRDQRASLYDRVESGAAWSFDFMALMTLATAIAALGLLQNSGAVVIGAMLVAPLMTPILAIGLALLQGNLPLLHNALRAVVQGWLVALLIGVMAGLVFPIPRLTQQLIDRGGPTLLDMAVAFLSGAAAAYCLGRPGLIAALPGVAIAAALVPPIATTGISLALGRDRVALGSSLLFGTNVVAIVIGATAALYAVGIRGSSTRRSRWPSAVFLAFVVCLVWFSIPLARGSVRALTEGGGVGADLERVWAERLGARGVDLVSTSCSGRGDDRVCSVVISSEAPLEQELSREWVETMQGEIEGRPQVRLVTQLEVRTVPRGRG